MSTTEGHSNIPSTAVQFAPGLWRTNLQRYDLSVPGREMIHCANRSKHRPTAERLRLSRPPRKITSASS